MKYPKKRVIVYVDGFNLYYGALRDEPHRWLDLEALGQCLIKPGYELVGVKYFTAKVKEHPDKPGQAARQRKYLRALKTLANVEIYYGQFLVRKAVRKLTAKKMAKNDNGLREVWIYEEKGSDVNLATHLIADGFRARYDLAIVISNDGDLKWPVEFVRKEFNPVGIINPHKTRSYALSPRDMPAGSFYQRLQKRHLRRSQLPTFLKDAEGRIKVPKGWAGS